MIRQLLLAAFVSGLAVYAFRDWYKSLCGLILLMAVIEHPDMPKSIMGVQGLNPWNLLLMIVVVAWFLQRQNEGLTWDMPRKLTILLVLYFSVVLTSFGRMRSATVDGKPWPDFQGEQVRLGKLVQKTEVVCRF